MVEEVESCASALNLATAKIEDNRVSQVIVLVVDEETMNVEMVNSRMDFTEVMTAFELAKINVLKKYGFLKEPQLN